MEEKKKQEITEIDEEAISIISEEEAQQIKNIQKKFMESYLEKKADVQIETWLSNEIAENLPEYSEEEINQISNDIIFTLKIQEEKKSSLDKAIANGRSKESWFAGEVKKATSHMSTQEASVYLQGLDDAIKEANDGLCRTIMTKSSDYTVVSQNTNLDGFIAEQHHVNSFNLKAKAAGSDLHAEVLTPSDGKTYARNSVDIVIKDGNGKIVYRYQAKYGATAEDTIRMIKNGNYRGQQLLVPAEQVEAVQAAFPNRKVSAIIGDGEITSTVLTKQGAKALQIEAQSGKWNELNWNEYKVKDLAVGIGKQAGQAALMGAAVSVGFDVAQKVWNGEEIKGEELVETALVSGTDIGVKAAAAGALKVGIEKNIINVIPKGTPAGTIANITNIAVENVKTAGKMASGELTVREGIEKMEQTTVSTVAGIAASTKGASIGAAIGSVLGPVGTAVGSFIGGTVAYMAGSKVGEAVTIVHQKIRNKARDVVKSVSETTRNIGNSIKEGICNLGNSILSFFGF